MGSGDEYFVEEVQDGDETLRRLAPRHRAPDERVFLCVMIANVHT